MNLFIITVGVPLSGKSYEIKELNLEEYTVSTDSLRTLLGGKQPLNDRYQITSLNDYKIFGPSGLLTKILTSRFELGQTTILDSTGLYSGLNYFINLAKSYQYRIAYAIYDEVTMGEILIRSESRNNNYIPEEVYFILRIS